MPHAVLLFSLTILALTLGCSRSPAASEVEPTFVTKQFAEVTTRLDSVPLEQREPDGVSRFSGFAAHQDGDFYIADASEARVFRFAPDGRQVAVLGRRGEGPGEFLEPRYLSARADTLWVGQTAGRVSVFVRDSFVREFRLDSADYISTLTRLPDGGFVGTVYSARDGAVRWWGADGSLRAKAFTLSAPPVPEDPAHPIWQSITGYAAMPDPRRPQDQAIAIVTVGDSIWTVEADGGRAALGMEALGRVMPRVPGPEFRPTAMREYREGFEAAVGLFASESLVGFHLARGFLFLGAPHRLLVRGSGPWLVLEGGYPVLGAVGDTLITLAGANEEGTPVAIVRYRLTQERVN